VGSSGGILWLIEAARSLVLKINCTGRLARDWDILDRPFQGVGTSSLRIEGLS
jgi:hypothetical protein